MELWNSDHKHKVEVFIVNKIKTVSFRCEICFKKFSYIEAVDYIDRVYGIDKWREKRLMYEEIKILIKKYKKFNKNERGEILIIDLFEDNFPIKVDYELIQEVRNFF